MESMELRKRTKTELKTMAQDAIMDQIARVLGYYDPNEHGGNLSPDDIARFTAELRTQANRVAKIMGYDEAWSS